MTSTTLVETSTAARSPRPKSAPQSASMAFQRADPHPFVPRGFQAMEVQQREIMV
jgi:hypothetical protein